MAVLQVEDSCFKHGQDSMWYDNRSLTWACDLCYGDFLKLRGIERKWILDT